MDELPEIEVNNNVPQNQVIEVIFVNDQQEISHEGNSINQITQDPLLQPSNETVSPSGGEVDDEAEGTPQKKNRQKRSFI